MKWKHGAVWINGIVLLLYRMNCSNSTTRGNNSNVLQYQTV